MGSKKYYMFSMELSTLLRMSFILHRTRAHEAEMPTYQRLLVPSRLKGINNFLSNGGFFPNSVILNFADPKNRVRFEANPRTGTTRSRHGMLRIPNAFAVAYIIDGQHRIYGYAETDYLSSNTIPVVAFKNLESIEQLDIFMSINQNQKAVSASLQGTLEKDLYWDSDRVDSRMKALRSSIVIDLAERVNGPLYKKIAIGEDSASLSFVSFSKGLLISGLLPKAKGNQIDVESSQSCLYNIGEQNHNKEMNRVRQLSVRFLNGCFGLVEEVCKSKESRSFAAIHTNRGVYALLGLVGSLNRWLCVDKGLLSQHSTVPERLDSIEKFIVALVEALDEMSDDEFDSMSGSYGTSGEMYWFRTFQMLLHKRFQDFEPKELIKWKERQDSDLQDGGRSCGVEIERAIKRNLLQKLKRLFGRNWELEINSIKRKCLDRAEEEREKHYKEGLRNKSVDWTEMFTIMEYKSIIEKYWSRNAENDPDFTTFSNDYSLDIGEGMNSKASSIKWLSRFNSLRNLWAHEGTKDKGLSREEVIFIKNIHSSLVERLDSV